ncbi:9077_t:CDS:2, partial [Racocetra persica]
MTVKVPEKKDIIIDLSQLQLLFDKLTKSFKDMTKRIITASKPEQKELNLIVIRKFHEQEDEDPIEWFENMRILICLKFRTVITIATGYLSKDWYRENKSNIRKWNDKDNPDEIETSEKLPAPYVVQIFLGQSQRILWTADVATTSKNCKQYGNSNKGNKRNVYQLCKYGDIGYTTKKLELKKNLSAQSKESKQPKQPASTKSRH